jgi:hypothetical protein
MKKYLFLPLLLSVLISCVGNPDTKYIKSEELLKITIEEYSNNLTEYFLDKNNKIIFQTIVIYEKYKNYDEILKPLDRFLIFFFYGIKTDNMKKFQKFHEIINYNKNIRLIQLFNNIQNTDIKTFLEQQEVHPDLNDDYWALFCATGNLKYIDKIFEMIMNYYNETENKYYFLAAWAGMWLMSSNIQRFSKLKEYINTNKILSMDIREYIISNVPEIILEDSRKIYETQW